MKASETTLRELLEGTKQFQIPLFQRRYSWEKKNWTTLWEDLMSIYIGEVEDGYFMGTIVTQSTPGTADGISPFIVIDGQQRLTTLTLLLVALRNCFNTKGNKKAEDEINEQYLINKFKEDKGEDYYKILPTQTDKETYKNIVKNPDFKIEVKELEFSSNIYKAFIFLEKSVQSAKNDIDPEKLKNIILNKLLLVNITSDDRDNPYLIFESLNNKGLDLTQSDLIRNYIFMQFPATERAGIYQNQWLPLEKRFKNNNLSSSNEELKELTQSFWFYLRKDGMSVAEKEIYKQMKCKFDKSNDKHQQLQELIQFSNYYEKLRFPEKEKERELSQNLSALLRLDFKTCHVFLLNIYDIYEKNEISLVEFQEILCVLESYFVRRFFTDNSTRILGKVFDSLYKELLSKDDRSIVDRLNSVLIGFTGNKVFPTDDDFRKGFMHKAIYKQNDNDRVKFILQRIEGSFKSKTKEILKIESSNLSIEHIIPQKLNPDWKEYLGDEYKIIHEERLHTIGNLTLTADNSELSNKGFIQKKKFYQESKLTLNNYFNTIYLWNAEEIEKRANYLADIALQIWAR
jgi:uncharacterized protein with ParB-like and HNH nuclease domain